ncbi:MAG: HNH endonuclease [Solirubrobacteraceae bacterium]
MGRIFSVDGDQDRAALRIAVVDTCIELGRAIVEIPTRTVMEDSDVNETSFRLWKRASEFEIALIGTLAAIDRLITEDGDESGLLSLRHGLRVQGNRDLVKFRRDIQQLRSRAGLPPIRDRVPRETTWEVFAACGYRCVNCGRGDGVPLTIDHIVPISQGGSSLASNLQALCTPCNSRKHNRHFSTS